MPFRPSVFEKLTSFGAAAGSAPYFPSAPHAVISHTNTLLES
eukprot:COSAG04_NODE_1881_length_5315_cov_2.624041_1_plen_41_part_10